MFILVAAIFFILLLLVYGARRTEGPLEVGEREISEEGGGSSPPRVSVVAENLEVPWAIAFLPSGDMLVTERPGRLVRIGENGAAHTIEGVAPTSEGGLLGLAAQVHAVGAAGGVWSAIGVRADRHRGEDLCS